MFLPSPASPDGRWRHHNRYSADAACERCAGIIRHERWCATRNPAAGYAWRAVEDAAAISEADRLLLHALGVVWR